MEQTGQGDGEGTGQGCWGETGKAAGIVGG